jgi:hypothetical protein
MPAPRTCRDCGAALSPDLRWCGQCLAPVLEFAPRARFEGGFVDTPRHDVHYSRWKGGPTSFGPVGRILATLLVILFGPWTTSAFVIFYTPIWILVAMVALKAIWKKERIDEGAAPTATEGWRERKRQSHPFMFTPIGGKWVVWVAPALLAIGYVFMLIKMGSDGRFLIGALTLTVVLGLFLAWTADV